MKQEAYDLGTSPDRTAVMLIEYTPDGASGIATAILGGVTPPLGYEFTADDQAIADRLLRGIASPADYAHARTAGWQIWKYVE